MNFNSIPFLAFMAVVLVLYHGLQVGRFYRTQNRMLLIASYVFYGFAAVEFCGLLALSTVVNYALGRAIHRAGGGPGGGAGGDAPQLRRRRRHFLWLSLAFNLGLLGGFKYLDFFATNAAAFLGLFGMELTWSIEHVWLPLGISFYTFQTLSYTLDIYRRRFAPVDDFLDFALFVAFFPQLVMGPIERAKNLLPQIQRPRTIDRLQFLSGGWLVFLGLYKKIFVADQIGRYCDPLFAAQGSYAGWDVALGALLFTLQIYADFSGYSDIARGCARMLGFDLMQNFSAPYLARNVQDFWNRWHISLTTWIRDYVFYPMAVSRRWNARLGIGGLLVTTMVLMGFWHGASWMFVLWGAYHGTLLAAYGKLRPTLYKNTTFTATLPRTAWTVVCVLFTFALVVFGELLFRPESTEQSFAMIHALFTNPTASEGTGTTLWIAVQIVALLFVLDFSEILTGDPEDAFAWPIVPRRTLQVFMLYCLLHALANHSTELGEPFKYFKF